MDERQETIYSDPEGPGNAEPEVRIATAGADAVQEEAAEEVEVAVAANVVEVEDTAYSIQRTVASAATAAIDETERRGT